MPIPQINEILHPFMINLMDLRECSIKNMSNNMGIHFSLSEEEKEQTLPSGKETILKNRVGWARTFLKKSGLVDSPMRGWVTITAEGIRAISLNRIIDIDFLETIPSFVEFRNRKPKRQSEPKSYQNKRDETPNKTEDKQVFTSPDIEWNKALLAKIPAFDPEWSEETLNKWLDTISKLKG